MAVAGGGRLLADVASVTLIHRHAPDEVRSRVFAAQEGAAHIAFSVSAFSGGLLVSAGGARSRSPPLPSRRSAPSAWLLASAAPAELVAQRPRRERAMRVLRLPRVAELGDGARLAERDEHRIEAEAFSTRRRRARSRLAAHPCRPSSPPSGAERDELAHVLRATIVARRRARRASSRRAGPRPSAPSPRPAPPSSAATSIPESSASIHRSAGPTARPKRALMRALST